MIFIFMLALFFSCALTASEELLSDLKSAIHEHDFKKAQSIVSEKLILNPREKKEIYNFAQEEIEKLQALLDEPQMTNLLLGLSLLPLSGFLIYKQIPRLQGKVVEYNSPRIAYAGAGTLFGIGTIGVLFGLYRSLVSLKRYLSGENLDEESIRNKLKEINLILKMFNKS